MAKRKDMALCQHQRECLEEALSSIPALPNLHAEGSPPKLAATSQPGDCVLSFATALAQQLDAALALKSRG